ncbi:MAG: sigma factor-like helix-turn-helix DNA-binding protein [Candidatus Dormibacteraceae bacterium]
MLLDTLAARQRQIALLERYGALLTDRQREVLGLSLRSDWSLSEIAAGQGTSRAAVHDLLRRALAALEGADQRLRLLEEDDRRRLADGDLAREVRALRHRLARLEARLAEA